MYIEHYLQKLAIRGNILAISRSSSWAFASLFSKDQRMLLLLPMFGVLSYFRHIFHLLHHWLKVIESMSSEDQSGFVRFAWGRSRLPPKAFWRVNMKLLRSNMSEESLPVSSLSFSRGDLVLTDGAHQ